MSVKLNPSFITSIKHEDLLKLYREKIQDIFQSIQSKQLIGSDMMGWIPWIFKDHTKLFSEIKKIREKWISDDIKNVVVIGTGGSYIGSKACLNYVHDEGETKNFNFIFVPSFSERYIGFLLKKLKNENFAIVVISKSGTTLESSISFRFFRNLLFQQKQEKYNNYIISVTDKTKGILRDITNKNKFHSFEIEDDIGGRYSALTSVGLVPMILSGIDGESVIKGALDCYNDVYSLDFSKNSAAQYAAYRHYFFTKENLSMECIASYDPQLGWVLEKMKQLFAESEGKNNKGLMPVLMNFTPDLHSVGQLLQDGPKKFFETIVLVSESKFDLKIKPSIFGDDDRLDWIENKTLKNINDAAFLGTVSAHKEEGKINNLVIELKDWSEYNFGYFYFWLSLTAMFSAYLFEVNPFDQPGVESYKKRMFELLRK